MTGRRRGSFRWTQYAVGINRTMTMRIVMTASLNENTRLSRKAGSRNSSL
jgi:hypothetical protein